MTPLALKHRKRPASEIVTETRPATERKNGKGKPKGICKGKGEGMLEDCGPVTPDGQGICFDLHNRERTCQRGQRWRFAHVCGRCFQRNTPLFECNHQGLERPHKLKNVKLGPQSTILRSQSWKARGGNSVKTLRRGSFPKYALPPSFRWYAKDERREELSN